MKKNWILSLLQIAGFKNKTLVPVLCISVFMLLASFKAEAADFTFITNANNTITITDYTGPGGAVTIPGTINGRTVTHLDHSAFWVNDGETNLLTRVMIPNSIKEIGSWAFGRCSSLTQVVIGSGVTNIGVGAFGACSSLTSITLPDSVTRLGDVAFTECSRLTQVVIGKGLTTIGGRVFFYCANLKEVYFKGNVPVVRHYSSDTGPVFEEAANATAYYLAGTIGWGTSFEGAPTAVWNQTNLVLNPSFEIGGTAPASWKRGGSAIRSATTAQSGTNSLRIAAAGANAATTQTIALKAGTTYDISVWINASGMTSGKAIFDTSDKYDGAGQGQFVISAANAGWTKYSGRFTATNTSVTLRLFTDSAFKGTIYFDNVILAPATQLSNPWKTQDIGTVGRSGGAAYNNGTYTVQGAGRQIGGTSDALRYVHQVSSGDCDIKVKVISLTNTAAGAKSGVMIRESLNGNARAAGVWVSPTNGIYFTYRTATGSTATNIVSTGKKAPYWVRLTRTGNTFKAYYGTTGTNWTQLGANTTISMATNAYIGIGLCSGDTNKLATTVISNVTATP